MASVLKRPASNSTVPIKPATQTETTHILGIARNKKFETNKPLITKGALDGGAKVTCIDMTNCLLDGGVVTTGTWGAALCCAETLTKNPNQTCTNMDTVKSVVPTAKPPSLCDQIKRPQSTTLAPEKAVTLSKPPTVAPIKQYQKKEAPAKASQTMSR